jgi:hypothetical protein
MTCVDLSYATIAELDEVAAVFIGPDGGGTLEYIPDRLQVVGTQRLDGQDGLDFACEGVLLLDRLRPKPARLIADVETHEVPSDPGPAMPTLPL